MTSDINNLAPNQAQAWYAGPFFILALMLMLTCIAYPLAQNLLGDNVVNIVISALLASALYAVNDNRLLFRSLAILILPLLALNWLIDPDSVHEILERFSIVATEVFFVAVMIAVFIRVIRSRTVTTDVIFGSIAVYLLFGFVMAMTYQLANGIDAGNIITGITDVAGSSDRQGGFADYLYFSFVTLTSVGYGDLAPISPAARSLAMFEGIVGQLYVAILIARLVGIHVAQE